MLPQKKVKEAGSCSRRGSLLLGLARHESPFLQAMSYLYFPDLAKVPQLCMSMNQTMKGVNFQSQIYSRILKTVLARTGRHVEERKLREDNKGMKPMYMRDTLAHRLTPWPTYFDWLANLCDWGSMSADFRRELMVSVKLRPDNIDYFELEESQPFFRGTTEKLSMNTGRRALVYQGRKLGGNRCVVANDHFPVLSAVTDLSNDYKRTLSCRLPISAELKPSRVPFTRLLGSTLDLSCAAYFEIDVYSPRPPSNHKPPSAAWLADNTPCVAIGIAYPSPMVNMVKKPVKPVSGDCLHELADAPEGSMSPIPPPIAADGVGSGHGHEEELDGVLSDDGDIHHGAFRLRRQMPGWGSQSIGYHSDDGALFDGDSEESAGNLWDEYIKVGGPSFTGPFLRAERDPPAFRTRFPTPHAPNSGNAHDKRYGPGDVVGCGIMYPPLSNVFTEKEIVHSDGSNGEEDKTGLESGLRDRSKGSNDGLLFFTKNGVIVYVRPFNAGYATDDLPQLCRPWFPVVGIDSYFPVEFNFGHSECHPLAFDVRAFEAHVLELGQERESVERELWSRGWPMHCTAPAAATRELHKWKLQADKYSPAASVRDLPPIPAFPKRQSASYNSSGVPDATYAPLAQPLSLLTSHVDESCVQRVRKGKFSRGDFIDWTRELPVVPGTSDFDRARNFVVLNYLQKAGVKVDVLAGKMTAIESSRTHPGEVSSVLGHFLRDQCANLVVDQVDGIRKVGISEEDFDQSLLPIGEWEAQRSKEKDQVEGDKYLNDGILSIMSYAAHRGPIESSLSFERTRDATPLQDSPMQKLVMAIGACYQSNQLHYADMCESGTSSLANSRESSTADLKIAGGINGGKNDGGGGLGEKRERSSSLSSAAAQSQQSEAWGRPHSTFASIGQYLMSHSLFLCPGLALSVRSLERAHRHHVRVARDAVVRTHSQSLSPVVSLARARLVALLETQASQRGSTHADRDSLIAASMSSVARLYAQSVGSTDEVMEEVWQMIMPGEEEEEEEEEEGAEIDLEDDDSDDATYVPDGIEWTNDTEPDSDEESLESSDVEELG